MNIGVFDSGIGGMTLLHQAMVTLPEENYIFYADTDHVPYGTKTKEQVLGYVDEILSFLVAHDCKAVIIACNTATSVAAAAMREKYAIPIIGIEPAVKPAVEHSAGKRVMVTATPLTIREEKLRNLVARVDDEHLVDLLPLPELVTFAERGEFTSPLVRDYLARELAPYKLGDYAELVLGCTHFNYFKDTLRALLPDSVRIIDGSEGSVNQLRRILEARRLLEHNAGTIRYYASGRELTAPDELEHINRLQERLEKMRKIS